MKISIRRTASFFFTIIMLIALLPSLEADRTHVFTEEGGTIHSIDICLHFDTSSITEITFEGLSYVTAYGYSIPFDEGEAALPFNMNQVLVHPDAFDIEIGIDEAITSDVTFMYPVAGIPRAVPYSVPEEVLPDLPTRYPDQHLSISGEGWTRGHRIIDIRFDPIIRTEYGRFLAVEELNARITFKVPHKASNELYRPFTRSTSVFRSSLEGDLLNPEDLDLFMARPFDAPVAALEEDDVQYVVITNTSYVKDGFNEFIDWKNRKGVPTRLVETSFIDDHYTGTDMPERIRNFIIDAVNTWDTEFVLIGGDIVVVPHRGAYARVYSSTQTSTACDLYFSDLDGTWNADGDGYWGETSDNVDMRPDVYVGRAPVQTRAECLDFVRKTLVYERSPPSGYLDNATFAGEFLDDTTNSSRGLDLIKNNLLPSNYNTTSMYDSGKGAFGNLNRPNFMEKVDLGASLVYHTGHCNWNIMSVGTAGSGSMYNSHIPSYSSENKFGILNSVGCIANKFNQNDCIIEKHVLEPDGGTIAGIGNSHYGWYAYGYPGFGPSEQFMYRMTDELFNQGHTRMGEHFAEGKDYYVSSSGSYNSARWIQIVLNLIGDPETMVRTAEPGILNVSMPDSIGMSYNGFPIEVRHENGTPMKDALVCLSKSDHYSYALTDSSGEALFNFSTSNLDPLNITITAYNYLPFERNISLDLIVPSIIIDLEKVATTGEEFRFNCTVFDEAGINTVHLKLFNDTNILDLEENGTSWSGNISIPWNSTEPIPFKVLAMDRSGNTNTTIWHNLTVMDNDIPWLVEDMSHHDAYTGDPHRFNVDADDNVGIASVSVNLEVSTGTRNMIRMQYIDGIWSHIHHVPNDSIGPRHYYYTIIDTSGNEVSTIDRSFIVFDDERPVIMEDGSDIIGTTSDIFSLRINVSDNIGIGSVHVEWWKDGWTVPKNDSMGSIDGTWSFPIQASLEDLSPIQYIFHVSDTSGNWNSTSEDFIDIFDDDLPLFVTDPTEPTVDTGGDISFRVNVIDNVGIAGVRLFFTQGSRVEEEIILTHGSGDLWGISQSIPMDSVDTIRYRFRAEDTSGNINWTENRTIQVLDPIPPSLEHMEVPASVNAGSVVNISVGAYDNICIKKVTLAWWIGGSEPVDIPMELDGDHYLASIRVPLEAYGTLYLTAKIRDGSDNTIVSDRDGVIIIEYVPEPVIDPSDNNNRIPLEGEDLDEDGMDDLWEYHHELDLERNDSGDDPDRDGFSNLEEFISGTDPRGPLSFPVIEETEDGPPIKILIAIATLLIIFIGAAILFVIIKQKIEAPQSANKVNDPHAIRHGIAADHHDVPHAAKIVEKDEVHPHSYPLSDNGIAHPHQHPVHPKD